MSQNATTPARRHRWRTFFRFGLKTLFVATGIIAICLWVITDRAQRQRRAVEVLANLGAELWYDYQKVPGERLGINDLAERCFDANARLPDSWLRSMLGDEYVAHPLKLKIGHQRVIDNDGLAYLPDLPHLEAIMVYRVQLRDQDLSYLRLPNLRYAHFFEGTLAQIEHTTSFSFLANCPRLEDVILSGQGFRGDAAKYLSGLTRLRGLALRQVAIDDAGLGSLRDLTRLELLELEAPNIGDVGLGHLREMKALVALSLRNTRVTDDGLRHLEGFTNLGYLNLDGTAVTDAGVEHLRGLPSLKRVEVHAPAVTARGVERWRAALPTCNVNPEPLPPGP